VSNWFRFYDDTVNDPKIIRLPDDMHRAWVNLLCIAAKNDGVLPELCDVALILRVKDARAAELITKLVKAKLLDDHGGIFSPHNWQGRQFKSDDSGPRVRKHREKKLRNVTVTVPCNVTSLDNGNAPEEKRREKEEKRADARDELQKRIGNFRQAIVQVFEASNSPTAIETSRAELWLTQGYQEDICLAVIAGIVRKNPAVSTLNYFDGAIKEAHASKAPPRQPVVMRAEDVDWDATLKTFKETGYWSRWAGPDLTSPACRCPPEMLTKHGLLQDGRAA
jgi:hypothetical protein